MPTKLFQPGQSGNPKGPPLGTTKGRSHALKDWMNITRTRANAFFIAYDRGGHHSGLLIRRIDAKAIRKAQELDLCRGACSGGLEPKPRNWEDSEDGEAMTQAIEHFLSGDHEDLDEMVEVTVSIKDEPETVVQFSA